MWKLDQDDWIERRGRSSGNRTFLGGRPGLANAEHAHASNIAGDVNSVYDNGKASGQFLSTGFCETTPNYFSSSRNSLPSHTRRAETFCEHSPAANLAVSDCGCWVTVVGVDVDMVLDVRDYLDVHFGRTVAHFSPFCGVSSPATREIDHTRGARCMNVKECGQRSVTSATTPRGVVSSTYIKFEKYTAAAAAVGAGILRVTVARGSANASRIAFLDKSMSVKALRVCRETEGLRSAQQAQDVHNTCHNRHNSNATRRGCDATGHSDCYGIHPGKCTLIECGVTWCTDTDILGQHTRRCACEGVHVGARGIVKKECCTDKHKSVLQADVLDTECAKHVSEAVSKAHQGDSRSTASHTEFASTAALYGKARLHTSSASETGVCTYLRCLPHNRSILFIYYTTTSAANTWYALLRAVIIILGSMLAFIAHVLGISGNAFMAHVMADRGTYEGNCHNGASVQARDQAHISSHTRYTTPQRNGVLYNMRTSLQSSSYACAPSVSYWFADLFYRTVPSAPHSEDVDLLWWCWLTCKQASPQRALARLRARLLRARDSENFAVWTALDSGRNPTHLHIYTPSQERYSSTGSTTACANDRNAGDGQSYELDGISQAQVSRVSFPPGLHDKIDIQLIWRPTWWTMRYVTLSLLASFMILCYTLPRTCTLY